MKFGTKKKAPSKDDTLLNEILAELGDEDEPEDEEDLPEEDAEDEGEEVPEEEDEPEDEEEIPEEDAEDEGEEVPEEESPEEDDVDEEIEALLAGDDEDEDDDLPEDDEESEEEPDDEEPAGEEEPEEEMDASLKQRIASLTDDDLECDACDELAEDDEEEIPEVDDEEEVEPTEASDVDDLADEIDNAEEVDSEDLPEDDMSEDLNDLEEDADDEEGLEDIEDEEVEPPEAGDDMSDDEIDALLAEGEDDDMEEGPEDEEEEEEEIPEEEPVEAKGEEFAPVVNPEDITPEDAERLSFALLGETGNQHWVVLYNNEPLAKIAETDQNFDNDSDRDVFRSASFEEVLIKNFAAIGIHALTDAGAKFYAAAANETDTAKRLGSEIRAESQREYAKKTKQAQDSLLNAVNLVLASMSKGRIPNRLAAAVCQKFIEANMDPVAAVKETQAIFEAEAPTFFQEVVSTAQGYTTKSDEFLAEMQAEIEQAQSVDLTAAFIGGSYSDKLKRGNVPLKTK